MIAIAALDDVRSKGKRRETSTDGGGGAVRGQVDDDGRDGQRVAERDQVRGAFRGHDAGEAGDAEHVAFFGGAGFDHGECFTLFHNLCFVLSRISNAILPTNSATCGTIAFPRHLSLSTRFGTP